MRPPTNIDLILLNDRMIFNSMVWDIKATICVLTLDELYFYVSFNMFTRGTSNTIDSTIMKDSIPHLSVPICFLESRWGFRWCRRAQRVFQRMVRVLCKCSKCQYIEYTAEPIVLIIRVFRLFIALKYLKWSIEPKWASNTSSSHNGSNRIRFQIPF